MTVPRSYRSPVPYPRVIPRPPDRACETPFVRSLLLLGAALVILALSTACGPKPQSRPATVPQRSGTEAVAAGKEAGARNAQVNETVVEDPSAPSSMSPGESGEISEAATQAASVEELLAAAEAALAVAAEELASGDTEGYRTTWAEALAALRRAEAKLIEDPAAFPFLRPAYEKLCADLREGLAPPAEPVDDLDASAEELAHTEEVHATNGAIYEMPIDPKNPLTAKYLALFQEGRRREALEQAFERAGRYRAQVLKEIRARRLPEELWVVPVIESGYKLSAYSRARAVGPWQFMTSTARHYGLVVNEWVDERRDPIKSTRAALDYLKDLYKWFNSWDFALAAYNRGEGGIHRDIERSRIADFMEMAELGATHRETQNHVPQIHAAAIIAKHPEQYGFKLKDEPIPTDTVEIDYIVDLEVAAHCAGISEEELREFNPELRTWVTPVLSKDYPTYTLKMPRGKAERYREEIAKVEDKTPKRQVLYAVRRGDTIGSIARKFGVGVTSIKRWNHLRSSRIRPGQRLVVMGQRARGVKKTEERELAAASPSGAGGGRSTSGSSGAKVSGTETGSTDVTLHTVRKGDTLYAIAKLYNTTVDNLRRMNKLGRTGRIFPGQRLRVSELGLSGAEGG